MEDWSFFQPEFLEALNQIEIFLLRMEEGQDFPVNMRSCLRNLHVLSTEVQFLGLTEIAKKVRHVEELLYENVNLGYLSKDLADSLLVKIDGIRHDLSQTPGKDSTLAREQQATESSKESKAVPMVQQARERIANEMIHRAKFPYGLAFVVEDEELIRKSLSRKLKRAGFDVLEFEYANDALVKMAEVHPDIIISDIKMDGIDGLQLLDKVHEHRPYLPVILVSGYLTTETCIDALSKGVSGVMAKPFKSDQLVEMCKHNVKRYRAQRLLDMSISYMGYQIERVSPILVNHRENELNEDLMEEFQEILELKKSI
ncbi:Response regulator receiver domain-containing protein [Pseudobacteriovorax antillogorgiicola]|uniref:Response regulator receiver domain-containing protein n=2 Tax=Pseudobacteriovorax antillogorgiicola TaxID=1513793 RepID=A0A1Y6BFJ5_9BACT|nr:response regulator receiver domain-containing protein [Pseudobacteriovorax antillogorgiicola]SMF05170.1 Response regulator receiver domain-containing protein [Pseudobacteriovorax antillogorgiicola]